MELFDRHINCDQSAETSDLFVGCTLIVGVGTFLSLEDESKSSDDSYAIAGSERRVFVPHPELAMTKSLPGTSSL